MKNRGMVSHIELYVNNLEKSLMFWEWFLTELGYEVFQEWDKGKSFIKEMTYIVFVQTEDRFSGNIYHRCHHGLNHLAFYAERDFIDEMKVKLINKGISILYKDRYPSSDNYALFFEDPDRMKVELVTFD